MSHLFSLGRIRPICFPWASSALFLTLHSHGLLLNSLGFPIQLHYPLSLGFMGLPSIPYFPCFHYFRLDVAHSHFSTSYTAHGSLFLSFWAPLSPFTSSRPNCLSHGLVIHYSCDMGLIDFLSICQLFSVRVAGLSLSTWASKMAINNNIMWIFITTYLACEYLYTIYLACECLQHKNKRGRVKKIAPYCHSPCFSHLSCKNIIERTLMPRNGEDNMLAWLVPIGSIKLNHRHKPLKMQF